MSIDITIKIKIFPLFYASAYAYVRRLSLDIKSYASAYADAYAYTATEKQALHLHNRRAKSSRDVISTKMKVMIFSKNDWG